ncbi:toprim domain-containing protein [Bacillus thuringiensis]|uniref:DNA topoisomerase (ATP-hydrolyzing) n=2 Tax=Bacillus thuringiensis TaxID=1428 RepID=A0A7D4D0G2_BACTU|nr:MULTISPECIES: toprim domain-containing protein [Bacillus]EAO56885.1 DNA gyrase subunit B [Bacillus thuringiensis serovar israelensis ATCC 35646]MEC2535174.1 toprim domain-containing protein [Bacillus cereus]MED1153711.1 toprim domain-containing protein [Bacillus paranthracis]OUB09416.1 DNA gyrase subunit B [Bacillus thuringiensis serovar yunnanensis]AND27995.1 DNA gyrase subunit B [Bacillus thuringiensis serovar israelensis]
MILLSQNYGNNSIDSLEGAERVRRRPAAVLGSSGIEGARHGVTEIVGNSVDEGTAGFGSKLDINYFKDGSISIRDYGRGVPMGYNENKGISNWFLVFNEMYAGGKYKDYQEELRAIKDWSTFNPTDYNYLFSIGLNGLGAASTQYTSEFFEAISITDGIATKMEFRGGYPILKDANGNEVHAIIGEERLLEEHGIVLKEYVAETYETEEENGTYIHWKPDIRVFSDVDITLGWIKDVCESVAYISGLDVNLYDEATDTMHEYQSGTISDLNLILNEKNLVNEDSPSVYEDNDITHGNVKQNNENFIYVFKADVSVVRTREKGKTVCFHNAIKMKGGAQYRAVDSAVADFVIGLGNTKGVKVVERDFEGKLGVVVKSYSNVASYKGQTKDEVDDNFIYRDLKTIIYRLINTEYHKGNKDIIEFVDKVLEEAELRITLQEQAKMLREVKKTSRTRKLPEKFLPSKLFKEKIVKKSELWIVEGDSAKTSVKNARDPLFQAIYAVRGKVTNALKASFKKLMESEEIRDIFSLLGTGMDVELLDDNEFDIDACRFEKIIIGTDADEDGYQIRVLLFVVFWVLAPEIIKRGMLYIGETPKFGIKLSNGEMVYAINEVDKAEREKEYAGQIVKVERYKGLGEVNADVLGFTTLAPETRNLIQIKLDPADHILSEFVETLFGKDPYKKRKETMLRVLGSDAMDMFNDTDEKEEFSIVDVLDADDVEEENELEVI